MLITSNGRSISFCGRYLYIDTCAGLECVLPLLSSLHQFVEIGKQCRCLCTLLKTRHFGTLGGNAEEINIPFCRPVNNYTTLNMDRTRFLPPTLWKDNCVSMVTQSGAFTSVLHQIGARGCYYLLANQ